VADRRIVRLIQKWLNAGVLEDGNEYGWGKERLRRKCFAALANVYLHYVFDLWIQAWRRKRAHVMSSSCDSLTISWLDSRAKADAEQFRAELTERMRKFHLALHPEKRGCWNLVRLRSTTGKGVEKGSPRHSAFSASRISA